MSLHDEFISKLTYEKAFKRILPTYSIDKLKALAKHHNMSLSEYLIHMINVLYSLKFNSNNGGE